MGIRMVMRFTKTITCLRCRKQAERYIGSYSGLCEPCMSLHRLEGREAVRLVATAKRHGKLPRADSLPCADCGGKARDYDHRDYMKPLDVQAVCHGCNVRRGTAFDSVYRPAAGA